MSNAVAASAALFVHRGLARALGRQARRAADALAQAGEGVPRLLRPGEPGFGGKSAVESVEVRYPARSTPIFGIDLPDLMQK